MSPLLRYILLTLAQLHMVLSFILLLYVMSPLAEWACSKGTNPIICRGPVSVWNLDKLYPESVAYSVQALLICAACLNFASIVLGTAHVYKEVVSILDALTFAVGLVPWALVIGFLDKEKGRLNIGTWVAVGSSFVTMVGASLAMVASFMPDSFMFRSSAKILVEDEEAKDSLLVSRKKDPDSTSVLLMMEFLAYVAVISALGSLFGLNDVQESYTTLGAKGCQIAVLLLSFDVAILTTSFRHHVIDIAMGAIVSSSMSLVGWITGIVGCSLTAVAVGSFDFAATCALVSLLALVAVFGIGIYVGTHFA